MLVLRMIERRKRSASNASAFAFALMGSLAAHVVQKVQQTGAKVRLCRSMWIARSRRHRGGIAVKKRRHVPALAR
jgi:hypothetical protein